MANINESHYYRLDSAMWASGSRKGHSIGVCLQSQRFFPQIGKHPALKAGHFPSISIEKNDLPLVSPHATDFAKSGSRWHYWRDSTNLGEMARSVTLQVHFVKAWRGFLAEALARSLLLLPSQRKHRLWVSPNSKRVRKRHRASHPRVSFALKIVGGD